MSENIILFKEFEKAEKERKEILKTRNKASFLIEDAKARYIKQKTRAKSKKAALEKEGILSSARFDVLKDYDRFDDINEAYGYDVITEKERDRLEALWEEREQIRNNTNDEGIYSDPVTEALHAAWLFLQDYKEDEVQKYEVIEKTFQIQRQEAEQAAHDWEVRQNTEYQKLKEGGNIP